MSPAHCCSMARASCSTWKARVKAVYTRILAASSHSGIVELNRGRVGRRQFPRWRMRSVRVDELALGKIAISDWTGFRAQRVGAAVGHPDRLLSAFCNRRRKQARVASSNQTGSWHDEAPQPPRLRPGPPRRPCGWSLPRGSGRSARATAYCSAMPHAFVDGGDQLFLFYRLHQPDLRAMGASVPRASGSR